jgi:hypothetical protein
LKVGARPLVNLLVLLSCVNIADAAYMEKKQKLSHKKSRIKYGIYTDVPSRAEKHKHFAVPKAEATNLTLHLS